MFFRLPVILIALLSTDTTFSQAVKKLPAIRTAASITIDGYLKEAAWKEAKPATGFIEFRPHPGVVEPYEDRTEVYILYDNNFVYVGGYCHEKSTDSISRELVGRDKIGNSDFVGVIFDTYYDKINASGFYVTAYGEQYDAKYSPSENGEDDTWNAVWDSEAKMQADGWTFEMRIPYSALRFRSKPEQTWGLNIIRRRQKTTQQFSWNYIDPDKNGFINQEGEWTGIDRIKSPVRLSFTPYLSAYIDRFPNHVQGAKDLTGSFNGGMDLKYGISQGFTLDMTLVPDFGQVQSDNHVLNLTPFEVKYNENRSFFTEGTELFNKGNLFYSRRIGGQPLHFYDVAAKLDSNEHIVSNPTESKLLNATKISGRTGRGLGIGFFNAITQPMYAEAENPNGITRRISTNPLTNYNIIVLDQTLKNNSSVSLINTNVLRKGSDYNANVTAALFDLNNKKNSYNWFGKFYLSSISELRKNSFSGYSHILGFSKTSGQFSFNFNQQLTDSNYNPNDLGLLFINNFLTHELYLGYHWTTPRKWYNNIYVNNDLLYTRRFRPDDFQNFMYNFNVNGQLKNLWRFIFFINYKSKGNDFYEARSPGRVFGTPSTVSFKLSLNSNASKKYYWAGMLGTGFTQLFHARSYTIAVENNYRFNDKFSVGHSIDLEPSLSNAGYAAMDGSDIIFSRRDISTVENIISSKYNFNKRTGITFRARHYWSKVISKEYFTLLQDGHLLKNPVFNGNTNLSFNAFNIDMVYTWQFAAGSFVNVVWKDAIYSGGQDIAPGYFSNFNKTLSQPHDNNISLKVIYYLDYLSLKKKH